MKRKVLIVDDDPFARKVLGKFLRSFPCTVIEAGDGLEALALIATEEPDLVFLDVNMPVMDGLQTLREIRSSTTYAQLPVVSVSSATERETVTGLLELGISAFLVKPLRPDETYRRLDLLFRSLKNATLAAPGAKPIAASVAKSRLLLVEQDPNFREFARPLFESHFEVIEAATGAVGWRLYAQHQPPIVCLGENLQLLGAEALLGLIRGSNARVPSRVYLVSETREPEVQRAVWDGILRKSFVPDAFCRDLRATLLTGESVGAAIAALARTAMRGELVTATQQTLGVLTSQDVEMLEIEEVAELPWSVQATTRLTSADGSAMVRVGVFMGESDAESLGSKILGQPTSLDDGGREAITELVSTIAGRVCASLAGRGFRLEQQPPTLEQAADDLERDWEIAIPFRTHAGERFFVPLWVTDGVRSPVTLATQAAG